MSKCIVSLLKCTKKVFLSLHTLTHIYYVTLMEGPYIHKRYFVYLFTPKPGKPDQDQEDVDLLYNFQKYMMPN